MQYIEKYMKGNDREPIQWNYTSCPRHQTGKKHKQWRQNKNQHKQKAKHFPNRWPPDYPKQNTQELEDKQKPDEQWQLD